MVSQGIELEIIEPNLEQLFEPTKNGTVNSIIIDSTLELKSDIYDLDKKAKGMGQPIFTHQYYIDKDGNIFKGRKEIYSAYINKKFCRNTFGIMIEGDFNQEEMNDIQLNSLVKVVKWLQKKYDYIKNNIYLRNEIEKPDNRQSPGMLFPFVTFKNRVILDNMETSISKVGSIREEFFYDFGSRYLEYKIPLMKGNDVYQTKFYLYKLGYLEKEYLLDVEKAFTYDRDFVPYVRKFKKTYGLKDDDIIDTETYKLLVRMLNLAIYDRSQMYARYMRLQSPEMVGFDVKLIKDKLYALGLYEGVIDNIYNDELAEAVVAFESRYGMLQNGEVGALTFIEILRCEDIRFRRILELKDPMMQGSDIEAIQKMLQKKGYSVTITGYYDIRTKNAVTQFQIDNNFLVDGKVDREVFEAIMAKTADIQTVKNEGV